MNIQFTLKGVKVSVPNAGVDVEVGELSYNLTDVKAVDLVTATKATLDLIKGMNEIEGASVSSAMNDFNFSAFGKKNITEVEEEETGEKPFTL